MKLGEINRRVAQNIGGRVIGDFWHRRSEGVFMGAIPLPDFCTDPAAADLVRQEIERRGWDWDAQAYVHDGGTRRYATVIGRMDAKENMFSRGRSESSSHMALCLAFLAACDAEKSNSGGGGE